MAEAIYIHVCKQQWCIINHTLSWRSMVCMETGGGNWVFTSFLHFLFEKPRLLHPPEPADSKYVIGFARIATDTHPPTSLYIIIDRVENCVRLFLVVCTRTMLYLYIYFIHFPFYSTFYYIIKKCVLVRSISNTIEFNCLNFFVSKTEKKSELRCWSCVQIYLLNQCTIVVVVRFIASSDKYDIHIKYNNTI